MGDEYTLALQLKGVKYQPDKKHRWSSGPYILANGDKAWPAAFLAPINDEMEPEQREQTEWILGLKDGESMEMEIYKKGAFWNIKTIKPGTNSKEDSPTQEPRKDYGTDSMADYTRRRSIARAVGIKQAVEWFGEDNLEGLDSEQRLAALIEFTRALTEFQEAEYQNDRINYGNPE